MIRPRTNEIEISRVTTPGGLAAWAVVFRDLYFGPRWLERHWTKPDAIRAAKKLSRKMRVPFVRDRRRPAVDQTKFAAWEKRQQRVAQRTARQAQKHSES
jgi:hypothetical protein